MSDGGLSLQPLFLPALAARGIYACLWSGVGVLPFESIGTVFVAVIPETGEAITIALNTGGWLVQQSGVPTSVDSDGFPSYFLKVVDALNVAGLPTTVYVGDDPDGVYGNVALGHQPDGTDPDSNGPQDYFTIAVVAGWPTAS